MRPPRQTTARPDRPSTTKSTASWSFVRKPTTLAAVAATAARQDGKAIQRAMRNSARVAAGYAVGSLTRIGA
jgi:hypothetical protein